jgi:hypothetical protein
MIKAQIPIDQELNNEKKLDKFDETKQDPHLVESPV